MIIVDVLTGSVRAGTSVLYASLGELIAERAGIVNLGTEGSMVAGALGAFAGTAITGNAWLGALFGGICGSAIALIHAFLVISRNANQLASGLAVMFFGVGITAFFGRSLVTEQIKGLEPIHIPLLSDIPWIGRILFYHDGLTYVSYLVVPLLWFVIFKTKWGVMLRATGEKDEVVFAYGVNPKLVKYAAVLAGGFLAGLGGAQLSIAFTNTWVENMTMGRGIIAVALVIFSAWNPVRAMYGAYLYGGAQSLQLVVQQQGIAISPYFLLMTPYVLTLVALYWVGKNQRSMMPEGLSKVFSGAGRS